MTRKRRAHLLIVFLLTAVIFAAGRWTWSRWNSLPASAGVAADYTVEEIAQLKKAVAGVGFDPEEVVNTVQVVRRALQKDDAKSLARLLAY